MSGLELGGLADHAANFLLERGRPQMGFLDLDLVDHAKTERAEPLGKIAVAALRVASSGVSPFAGAFRRIVFGDTCHQRCSVLTLT